MKNIYKKIILFAIGSIIGIILYKPVFGQDLIVTPIIPIPAKVVESTVINNIQYQITNTSAGSLTVTFSNLNTQGKTYTTTCGTVAASGTCLLNITFNVPVLPSGKSSEWYPHTFKILGGSSQVPYGLGTTIVQSEASITPTFKISLSDGTSCAGKAFDVTLTPVAGNPTVYNSVACGTSSPTPAIPGATYTLSVTPSSITASSKTFDAPTSFAYHLAKAGDSAAIVYDLNQDIAVEASTILPEYTGSVLITCNGPATYSHANSDGQSFYANMKPGSYTCTSPNYVGTDGKTYTSGITNPITIDATHTIIEDNYTQLQPTSTSVSTILTTPALPTGQTTSCTISDPENTYTHNQPAGTAHFAQIVNATDYSFSCANYTIGSDVYSMTTQTAVEIDATHDTVTGVFSKNAPPGSNYNWQISHLESLMDANVFLIDWGGGSTTGAVSIGTNPLINPWLNAQLLAYIDGTPSPLLSTAHVQGFPNYIAMGTVTTPDAAVTSQLNSLKMDSSFHYVGNGSGDRGCYVDAPAAIDASCNETDPNNTALAYDPLVDSMSAQASAVTTATGHDLIAGIVFYTIDMSDGAYAIGQDLIDDNLTKHFYNLAYEGIKMSEKVTAGTKMALFLNPDSVWPFQNCAQWSCPIQWKSGLTQDTTALVTLPNLQTDLNTAIDRLATKGLITSGTATTLKASLASTGILIPPVGSGRTLAGIPEYILAQAWVLKQVAANVPFGWGLNIYDNNNPLMTPGGVVPTWATASAWWVHAVNHSELNPTLLLKNRKYLASDYPENHDYIVRNYMVLKGGILNLFNINSLPTSVPAAINFEAQKLALYLQQMNLVGNAAGNYKPDFIYWDKYERDSIPGEIGSGWAWNGVDLDTYLEYIKDVDTLATTTPLPQAIWQMEGATIQVQGATTNNTLAGTIGMWVFGVPTLHNDFSNWDATQKAADNLAWTSYWNTTVYYTKNANVTNLEDYLKLTNASP